MDAPTGTDPKEDRVIPVKLGRTVVKIYPRPANRGRKAGFILADYTTGKRRQRWFTDLKAARKEALRIAALMNAGDLEGASMTGDDRAELVRATQLVAPFNLAVSTACELFAQAAKLVGPHQVVPAAERMAKQHPATRERHPLKETAEAYLEAKRQRKRSERTMKSATFYLGRFVDAHPGKAVGDFTGPDLQRWMDGLKRDDGEPLSPVSRKHYLVVVRGFFTYCHRRGLIVENPADILEREDARAETDVEFWSPAEARSLLVALDPIAVPATVLQLFCGLRAAEACETLWRDIDLEAGRVEVSRHKAKTRSRRQAPIPDNAKAWLLNLRGKPDAKIYTEHADTFSDRVTDACKRAGIRRLKNGARHTGITYRVALTGDVARVALDCGNSPDVIIRHYRGLATKEQAEEFFAIVPGVASKVVPFPPMEATG